MKTTFKIFFAIGGLFLFIAVLSFYLNMGPLYGQADNDNWVPDMRGEWSTEIRGYSFEDVTDPNCQPDYMYIAEVGDYANITYQNGRVFAGEIVDVGGGDNGKLVGVILPDRTVSVQLFDPSEVRQFATGKLVATNDKLEVVGYVHSFDEFGIRENPDKTMGSGYIRLTRRDE